MSMAKEAAPQNLARNSDATLSLKASRVLSDVSQSPTQKIAEVRPPPTDQDDMHACILHRCSTKAAETSLYPAILPSLVSAVMVVVGWYVVNKAQSNRERRKQIRDFVAALSDQLEDLESLTTLYHTSTRVETKEQEIIAKLGRFEKACSTLPRFVQSQKFSPAVLPAKLVIDGKVLQALRKAMTLEHFGDEHTHALSHHHDLIQNLALASADLQDVLECVRIGALD
jgi:hypothetical protein